MDGGRTQRVRHPSSGTNLKHVLRLIALWVACAGPSTIEGQEVVWNNPFESTLRSHEHEAWSLSAGTSMMMGMPTSIQSAWILNHGSAEEPNLDTLHQGIWRAQPLWGWHAGLDHIWLREDALWADRLSAGISVSQQRTAESFLGVVKGMGADTSVAFVDSLVRNQASAFAVGFSVQGMRAVATGPDGFVEVRTGLKASYNVTQTALENLPHFFQPATLPNWHVAWTAGIGFGLKIYRGRMIRLGLDVDLLQLVRAPSEVLIRPTSVDIRGLDWMQGGYRPWRTTLNVDLYQRKRDEGCAAPTRSTKSKTLFSPSMKGVGKAKNKGLKKAFKKRGS